MLEGAAATAVVLVLALITLPSLSEGRALAVGGLAALPATLVVLRLRHASSGEARWSTLWPRHLLLSSAIGWTPILGALLIAG